MSLIEQAAKRLEQLRRAGADVTDMKSDAGEESQHQPEPPTPEGIVRALGMRAPQPAVLSAGLPLEVPSPPASRPTARRAEIDLGKLAARGFVTPDMPSSQLADEFRVIKRPIIHNCVNKDGSRIKNRNLIMVTSALPAEGKTFTAVNLAMSIAMEFDNTVLLIDGDVAHPTLPNVLGIPSEPGLLDLLTRNDLDVADALVRTNVEKLAVLPAGSRQKRATELLASEQMARLLRELSSRYSDRIIIFDSPPLLAATEARVLASHMGQIIMVVGADTTTHHQLNQALATIESCEIVLMMLNKARKTDVGSYYGYYPGDDAQ